MYLKYECDMAIADDNASDRSKRYSKIKEKVIVIDAVMGSGKTYDAIQDMKRMREEGTRFIYITPFLDEIKRVGDAVEGTKTPFVQGFGPTGFKGKRSHFLELLGQGEDILTTHILFTSLLEKDYELMEGYVLILDEVIQPVNLLDIDYFDVEILLDSSFVDVDAVTGLVSVDSNYGGRRFADFKRLCDNDTIYLYNNAFLVWSFPPVIFSSFKQVRIMTYLFEGGPLSTYFKIHDIPVYIIKKDSPDHREKIKGLLNIYYGRSNSVGDDKNSFSKAWLLKKTPAYRKKIGGAASQLVKRNFKTKSTKNAYTTFKSFKRSLSGSGYAKGFIPVNSRSTNDFRDKETMVYLANRYLNPILKRYFIDGGYPIDQDEWALGELLQWLWRGCVRDGKPMNVYIPNSRMRGILEEWLDGENVGDDVMYEDKLVG